MQDIMAEHIGTAPVPPATTTDNAADAEQRLTTEITELWAIHTDAQSVVKKTQQELKTIRQNLGERLHTMKQLLARPGCQGGWSSFLTQHGISRTTADRLVASNVRSLSSDNRTSGAVPELTDEEIAQLAKATWKKLEKKLGTKRVVYAFLGHLIAESGLGNFKFTRGDQRGLAVVDPETDSAPQTTAPATSEPSDAVPTNAA